MACLFSKHFLSDGFRERILLLRRREGVTKQKLKKILTLTFRKQKISQVGFVRLVVIRLEAPGLNAVSLKPAFNKASRAMIAFGLKECPHHPMTIARQGN